MDFFSKVMMSLASAPGVVWFCKWMFERWASRDAAKLARSKVQDDSSRERAREQVRAQADLEKEEVRFLPETIRLYMAEMREQGREFREAINRMERESIRMRNYIIQLQGDYERARNRAFLCDTIIRAHDSTWVSHTLPPHDIPDFSDPK